MPGVHAGFICGWLFGDKLDKGLSFRMGQTHVHQLMPAMLQHIGNGGLQPDVTKGHHKALEDTARGHAMFDQKEHDAAKSC